MTFTPLPEVSPSGSFWFAPEFNLQGAARLEDPVIRLRPRLHGNVTATCRAFFSLHAEKGKYTVGNGQRLCHMDEWPKKF